MEGEETVFLKQAITCFFRRGYNENFLCSPCYPADCEHPTYFSKFAVYVKVAPSFSAKKFNSICSAVKRLAKFGREILPDQFYWSDLIFEYNDWVTILRNSG